MTDYTMRELLELRSTLVNTLAHIDQILSAAPLEPPASTTGAPVHATTLQQAAAQHPNPAPARALYHSIKELLPHLSERQAAHLLRAHGYRHQRQERCNVYWQPGT